MTTDPRDRYEAAADPSDRTSPRGSTHYDAGLSQDDVYELLSDARRRAVLACVHDRSESLALDDLADQVAVAEGTDRDHVRIGLHHVTLPKLDDLGAIEYDSRHNEVMPTDAVADLEPYLP